jgi:hypothetical protein
LENVKMIKFLFFPDRTLHVKRLVDAKSKYKHESTLQQTFTRNNKDVKT